MLTFFQAEAATSAGAGGIGSGSDILTSPQWLLLELEHFRSWLTQTSPFSYGSSSSVTLILLVSAVLGSLLQWRGFLGRRGNSKDGPLPPSPGLALPVIGHLHLLKTPPAEGGGRKEQGSNDPRVLFEHLRNKLGDIFSFYAGSRLVVVLNGYDVINEALVKKAAVFSHRPHTFMSEQMGKGRGIVNTSGRHWREQRQFAERALKSLGSGHGSALQQTVASGIEVMLDRMEQCCLAGRPLDPGPLLQASFCQVIISVIYGRRFDLDDPEFVSLMTALNNCFENFGNTEPLNFFPAVRFLPGDPYRYHFCIDNMNFLESRLVYPEIDEHERKLKESDAASTDVNANDVISAYLHDMTLKRTKGTPTFMDKENLVKVAGDILAGGTEPPSTSTWWTVLYLVHFPEVQEKCYQELVSVVGKDRLPTLNDRDRMPYLEATICEVQRHADVGPLAMAHGLARDSNLRGFHLPQSSIVLVNIHSVHRDPKAWAPDPEAFRPERFIGEDGKVKRPRHFMPYSLGPRVCPGEQMARQEMFLYISSILHRYRLRPHGDSPPSLQGKMTLMHTPRPFQLTLERRL